MYRYSRVSFCIKHQKEAARSRWLRCTPHNYRGGAEAALRSAHTLCGRTGPLLRRVGYPCTLGTHADVPVVSQHQHQPVLAVVVQQWRRDGAVGSHVLFWLFVWLWGRSAAPNEQVSGATEMAPRQQLAQRNSMQALARCL